MTVSDNAGNHWLSISSMTSVIGALALAITVVLPSIPANAQKITTNTPACHALKATIVLAHRGTVHIGRPDRYSIKAKALPPKGVLNPGQTYQIRYDITSDCSGWNFNCVDIKPLILTHRASIGADRTWLDKINKGRAPSKEGLSVTGSTHVEQYRCGTTKTRIVTFKVPEPKKLGGRNEDVSTVTMGICPPDSLFNCAGHTIRVRNILSNGWQISPLTTGQRAIGGGANRVPTGRPLTLKTFVANHTARIYWPASGGSLQLRQVSGPRTTPTQVIEKQSLPSFSIGERKAFEFQVGPLSPGTYYYRACLTGLKDARNYPAPELCAPSTVVTAGNPATTSWRVSAVSLLGGTARSIPANSRFRVQASAKNTSTVTSPPGARNLGIWRRPSGNKTAGTLASHLRRGTALPPKNQLSPGNPWVGRFDMTPLPAGSFELRACATDDVYGSATDIVCGPWTQFPVGSNKTRPTPQPAAPVANTCTGGRVFDRSQNRCICEGDLFWNPGLKRCYQCTLGRNWNASKNRCVCPSGTRWNPRANRCAAAQQTCTGGRVWNRNQRRCACPSGVKWNPRANRCGLSFQAAPTPQIRLQGVGTQAKITCTGGTVSNRTCLCPRGFTRKTVRANVYLCKPPLRRPVPKANRNQLKKPKAIKMRCIGGQVKGPLCWCGIGRFPKKIGNNAFRCQ